MFKKDLKLAAGILALFVVILYFPVTFSEYSFSPSWNAATGLYDLERTHGCTENCIHMNWTIDPGADGNQFWPVIKLISTIYSKGDIPLWDPYLGAGVPLAADQAIGVYSPLMFLYLLPVWLWDIPLLVILWLAGFFTFLLLGCWRLSYSSRLIGSLLFMFSGAFTWYLPHDSVWVTAFAPLLLFSIEKIIQDNKIRYTVLGCVAFTAAILGAHIESIALLVFFVLAYFAFRILQLTLTHKPHTSSGGNLVYFQTNKKSVLTKFAIIFVIGIGLTAFTILPTYEYLTSSGPLDRPAGIGLQGAVPYSSVSTFIPYILGPIHVYASEPTNVTAPWNSLGGYVAASALFFSIIGIAFSNKIANNTFRYIPLFFFGIAVFFVLKSIEFPIVNLIGDLPLFEHIVFARYDGFIWTLGFSIAAAFGVQAISERKINKKPIIIVAIISVSTILLWSLLLIPYFEWENLAWENLGWENVASYYIIFQILQSTLFIIGVFLLTLTLSNKKNSLLGILILVAIELSLYIPMGLHPWLQFYRSIVVLVGVLSLVIMSLSPYLFKNINEKTIKKIIISIFIAVMVSQAIVYVQSPIGLPLKNDYYESTPLTNFLKENLGDHRIFHLDTAFFPNYPAAYEIQSLGILSTFTPDTFNQFVHKFLDPYAKFHIFDYLPNWRIQGAPPMEDVFKMNKKYYDFFGVKYIIAFGTNPNTSKLGYQLNGHVSLGSENVDQTFTSNKEIISFINVQLGTYGQRNYGDVILTIDSIPFDESYHRQSIIKAENVANGFFSSLTFEPILNAKNTKFVMNLKFQSDSGDDDIAAFTITKTNPTDEDVDQIIEEVGGELMVNDKPIGGVMLFTYGGIEFPLIYSDKSFNVFENTEVFPRSFFVYDYEVVNSIDKTFEKISEPDFDLRNKVIIERDLPENEKNSISQHSSGDSTFTSYSTNNVELTVETESPGLLVLTDNFYPGWKAKVDGIETEVYRADGVVRAVFVPAGSQTVEFYYMPDSFVNGVIISLVTAGILCSFLAYSGLKNYSRHTNPTK